MPIPDTDPIVVAPTPNPFGPDEQIDHWEPERDRMERPEGGQETKDVESGALGKRRA